MSRFSEADHERIKRAAAANWRDVEVVQPRLRYRAPVLPSQDLAGVCNPMAECCAKRRVSLAMAEGDRSEFTREAFAGV